LTIAYISLSFVFGLKDLIINKIRPTLTSYSKTYIRHLVC